MSNVPSIDGSLFFECGTARYTAWPTIHDKILATPQPSGPLVVISTEAKDFIDVEWLQDFFDKNKDDVLCREFVKGVILLPSYNTGVKVSKEAEKLLQSWGNRWIAQGNKDLTPGPYYYKDNALWQAMRLYEDFQEAFLTPIKPETGKEGKYEILNYGNHAQWPRCSLAVPSRRNELRSSQKLFAGWRVALKDAFDINGVRTSLCNRAYLELYPPATVTAVAIAHVVEGGACIVGKTKLSSFLSREEPSESVDFQTAWNPRADGYQTPGGSSSGSAAAVAAYDWIDIGIGTDTNGSIRRPAQCNGVFGLRASQDVFSQEGMFTVFKHFDVPGIFARDLSKLASFAENWYGNRLNNNPTTIALPPKLIVPLDFSADEETPQKRVVLEFVKDLEAHLMIKADRVKITDLWAQNPPSGAKGQSLHDFLDKVGKDSFLYENYQSAKGFQYLYGEKFSKAPFASPFVRWRWKVGSTITEAEHEESMRRMNVYKQWFLNEVMQVGVKNSFVVMQSEDVTPKYRDDLPPEYYIQPAWHQWWLSPILGSPEIVIPAGQIPYKSRISTKTEHLPVTAQILSQPGSDLNLIAMVLRFLTDAGRPLSVESGKSMYSEATIANLHLGDEV